MAFGQQINGLQVITGSETYNFHVKREGAGRAVRIRTVPWEPASMPVMRWTRNLMPFNAGAARTKDMNSRGLSLQPQLPADTFLPEFVIPGPEQNALTLTSATQQVTKWVPGWDNTGNCFFGACGRYLIRMASDYTITAQDAGGGATNLLTDICFINGELVMCFGVSTNVKRRSKAGAITVGDFTAMAMTIVRDTIWRVKSANPGFVDNTLASYKGLQANDVSAVILDTNWTTTSPPYIAGDRSYQTVQLYDNGGTLACGRADGVYMPSPDFKFLNVTPQIARNPDPSGLTGFGCWSGFGYFFVPYHRGLLRLAPGESQDVGPGTAYIPKLGLRVMGGLEWDRMMYILAQDMRTNDSYILKMVPDKNDIADGEYIFQQYGYIAGNATHFGRAIGMFSAPTNPSLVFGGGSAATSASYIKLGRGAGRDVDDSGYQFRSGDSYVTTGIFAPSQEDSMVSTILNSQVWCTGAAALTPIVIQYSASSALMPGDNTFSDMTDDAAAGTAEITSAGSAIRYPARGTQSRYYNMRLKLTSVGGNTMAPAVLAWNVTGYSNPRTTHELTIRLELKDSRGILDQNLGTQLSQSEIFNLFTEWEESGTTIQFKLEGYADELTNDTDIISGQVRSVEWVQEQVNVDANASTVSTPQLDVTIIRCDFSNQMGTP